MATLQLRNVPDDLIERLAKRAAGENLTVEEELIQLLQSALRTAPVDQAKLLDEIKAHRTLTVGVNGVRDPAELIREDRER